MSRDTELFIKIACVLYIISVVAPALSWVAAFIIINPALYWGLLTIVIGLVLLTVGQAIRTWKETQQKVTEHKS